MHLVGVRPNRTEMTNSQQHRKQNSPKGGHGLIPGTCEYATLLGKRDIADVMKVRDLEIGR